MDLTVSEVHGAHLILLIWRAVAAEAAEGAWLPTTGEVVRCPCSLPESAHKCVRGLALGERDAPAQPANCLRGSRFVPEIIVVTELGDKGRHVFDGGHAVGVLSKGAPLAWTTGGFADEHAGITRATASQIHGSRPGRSPAPPRLLLIPIGPGLRRAREGSRRRARLAACCMSGGSRNESFSARRTDGDVGMRSTASTPPALRWSSSILLPSSSSRTPTPEGSFPT